MNKKIEIHYIVNVHLPNTRANGVQIAHTCDALAKRNNLTLITRQARGVQESIQDAYGITSNFKHVTLPCVDIPHFPFRYAIRNATFFIMANLYVAYVCLKNFFRKIQTAVYVRGELVLALIPLSYLVPVFFETHQIRNFEWLYRIALRSAQGVVVITEGLKRKFVEEYRIPSEKILMVRDAVDLEVFMNTAPSHSLWRSYGISEEKKIVLYSGSLSNEKGVFALADSAQHLPPDVQVVFLGGTDDQLKIFREKYGTNENISILGRVPYPEVPKHIVSADLLILPDSSTDTFSNLFTSPMKLFEYMASGRPIVASKVPSLLEVLTEKSAYFFESNNEHSLAKSIQSAFLDHQGSASRARAAKEEVSNFTWEKRGEHITQHIQACLS